MTPSSSPCTSRPPHRRGTLPLLLLALTTFVAFLQALVAADIECDSPSGSAQVGDNVMLELSDHSRFDPATILSISAVIYCIIGGHVIRTMDNVNNGSSWTIPSNILSLCSSGQVNVEYNGAYGYSDNILRYQYTATCSGLTIQAAPTTAPPSPSPSTASSTTAPTSVTTAMTSTSLASSISTLASTVTAGPSSFAPNVVSPTNISPSPISTGNEDDQTSKGSSKNTAVVAIGAVGGIAAFAFVVFGLVVVRRRQQRKRRRLSALGDGYPMKHRSDDGYGDDGYGFGTSGRGYVHSGMMSETTGKFGYGPDASHNYSNDNNTNYGHHPTGETYDYHYNGATPAAYFPYHDTMTAAAVVGAGAGAGAAVAGNGASDLNEYMPPPPALIPAPAVHLPTRPEASYKEEYSSAWEKRAATTSPTTPLPTSSATATASATASAAGGAGATGRFDRYGLDAYSYDEEDLYGGQVVDSNPSNGNPHDSFQSLSSQTNLGGITDQDYFRRLRRSIASTAAGDPNRDSAIDADLLPELPSPGFGFDGYSFPAPPTASAVSSSTPATTTTTSGI
ncbi:hypothetical protein EMPS_07709 [Entomortierella parvispora]|uniref:Mid2 domain-containing protein n=1 Tax=Entomortierella parvispora TaxID=205924 RepID=A0A9P3HEM3_9FUNG|nr:hypothetical protein EMPS_07709 [Entomortierella parvispora]